MKKSFQKDWRSALAPEVRRRASHRTRLAWQCNDQCLLPTDTGVPVAEQIAAFLEELTTHFHFPPPSRRVLCQFPWWIVRRWKPSEWWLSIFGRAAPHFEANELALPEHVGDKIAKQPQTTCFEDEADTGSKEDRTGPWVPALNKVIHEEPLRIVPG